MSKTCHWPFSSQNEIPRYLTLSNSLWLATQGTISFFSDLPTHIAPTSMIQPVFFYKASWINLCQSGFSFSTIAQICVVLFIVRYIILPSVPLILGVSQGLSLILFGNIQWLSMVPEKPTDYFTSAKSKDDEHMFYLYWIRSMGKMHLFSQNATVFLFFLKISYNFNWSWWDFKFIFLAWSIWRFFRVFSSKIYSHWSY